jgi:UPF0716 family protein affecting phage T7 exclusion
MSLLIAVAVVGVVLLVAQGLRTLAQAYSDDEHDDTEE